MIMLSVFCTAEERVSTHFTACCTRITLNVPNEEGWIFNDRVELWTWKQPWAAADTPSLVFKSYQTKTRKTDISDIFVRFHFKYFITRLNFFIHTWVVSVWQEAALLLSLCSCLNQATHEFVSLSLLSAHKELILTLKSTTKQPCRFLTQHSVHTEASLQSQWT